MNSTEFSLRHGVRNLRSKVGRSLVSALTVSLLILMILMTFSMDGFLFQVFEAEAKMTYPSTDVVITYDENSDVRIVNRRDILDHYGDDVVSVETFLNIYTLTKLSTEEEVYAEILSGVSFEFERLIDQDIENIAFDEAVISETFAKRNHVQIGDTISTTIAGVELTYTVRQIVADAGVFTGEKIFVIKDTLVDALFGFSGLDSLGNFLYVRLKSNVNVDEFVAKLYADPQFANRLVFATVDHQEIARRATYNATLFQGISLLMIVAIVLVIHSTQTLFYKEYDNDAGVMEILGAPKNYVQKVWNFSVLFLWAIASIVGLILTQAGLNIAASLYGVSIWVRLSWWSILLSLGAVLLLMMLDGYWIRRKNARSSVIERSVSPREKIQKPQHWLGILLILIILVNELGGWLSEGWRSLVSILASIFLCFVVYDWIALWLNLFAKKSKKKHVFHLFHLRSLSQRRMYHHMFQVMLTVFLLMASTLSVRAFIIEQEAIFQDQLQVDDALLGIFDYESSLKDEIESIQGVEQVDEASVRQNVFFHAGDEIRRFRFIISMEEEGFFSQFGFMVKDQPNFLFSQTGPEIVLPISYKSVYDIAIGDTISLEVLESDGELDFTVVGFLDTEFDQLAYVSLGTTNPDLFTTNALFLKTTPTSEVEHELVTRYAPRMYYIVSMSDFLEDFTAQLLRATDMFLFFSVVIVFALAIVVVDQIVLIFDVERSAFAKRWILGESPKTRIIALGLESGVLVFMLLIIGSVEALGFAAWFPKMMMLFRYYKQITPDLVSIGIAYGIVVTMMVLMYTWYTRLTFRADIISNSKK